MPNNLGNINQLLSYYNSAPRTRTMRSPMQNMPQDNQQMNINNSPANNVAPGVATDPKTTAIQNRISMLRSR